MNEVPKEHVEQYIKSQLKCEVISSKPEVTINDMDFEITIWNVKTNLNGSWWVATGGGLPMHFYPQDQPYYLSTDEVFSFHIGLMMRLIHDHETKPKHVIDFLSGKTDIAAEIRRKLELATEKFNNATEIEDFQAVGVICRETLIKWIKHISESKFLIIDFGSLKMADFKGRIEILLKAIASGKGNKTLRKDVKNLAFGVWDFSNELTHSSTKTKHDAGICLTLSVAFITSMEHLLLKYFDILSDETCHKCGSKKLFIAENEENDDILIVCDRCSHGHLKRMS